MHDRMHLQIVRRSELLTAQMTTVLLHTGMRPLVLRQILLAEERLAAFTAFKRSWSHLMRLLVRLERVFAREILTAHLAYVRPHTQVGVDVLLE